MRVTLPVAGLDVVVRAPAGADDLMIAEAGPPDLRIALALLDRVTTDPDGAPIDPAALPITDVDALLLRLRQRVLGDAVSAEATCGAPGCRTRVDVEFSIAAYLAHHAPEPTELVAVPAGEPGWYRLDGVEFRLPRADDQLAITRAADPEAALFQRCVRGETLDEAARARIEAAMEALAPSLCAELDGECPACGAVVEVTFDPLQYTLRELIARAAFIYDDVCAIAHWFHWSEAEILALPAARRVRYAELAAARAAERAST